MIHNTASKNASIQRVTFAIIGGGFSGCQAATQILNETALQNVSTLLIEEEESRVGGGIAYSSDCADTPHQTNIPIARMFADFGQQPGGQVVQRRLVGESIAKNLDDAVEIRRALNALSDAPCEFNKKYGRVVDLEDDPISGIKRIHFDDGNIVEAENVIVATGNSELRQLPQVTEEKLDDPGFEDHIMTHQWDRDEKLELGNALEDQNFRENGTVVIIGTALSGDDAVRTLIHSGFQGDILMLSRNGHRHFEYPVSHTAPRKINISPEFASHLEDYISTRNPAALDAAVESAVNEFEQLCGVTYDPKAKTIEKSDSLKSKFQDAFKVIFGNSLTSAFASAIPGVARYTSEEVLTHWQQYTSLLVEAIGEDGFGKLMAKHSAALNTLRVGAGADVSYEIKMAQEFGRLKIIAASIEDLEYDPVAEKMMVSYKEKGSSETQTVAAGYTISSLGPNYNYSKTKDPLWENILQRNYTTTHSTGIGVHTSPDGSLPGADGIYVIGPPTAGQRMIKDQVIGPPAFSVPGMRTSIRETVENMIDAHLESSHLHNVLHIQHQQTHSPHPNS